MMWTVFWLGVLAVAWLAGAWRMMTWVEWYIEHDMSEFPFATATELRAAGALLGMLAGPLILLAEALTWLGCLPDRRR